MLVKNGYLTVITDTTHRRDAVGGERVKRILESSDSSSNSGGEEEKGDTAAKVARMDNPTVFFISFIFFNLLQKSRGKRLPRLPRWTTPLTTLSELRWVLN